MLRMMARISHMRWLHSFLQSDNDDECQRRHCVWYGVILASQCVVTQYKHPLIGPLHCAVQAP